MTIGSVECTIKRRLLVNYRIDPLLVESRLPPPFRPQLVDGWAVGGVCFLGLTGLGVPWLPTMLGLSSENVAHRFAVAWDSHEETQFGVYVPRRDTDSWISAVAGGWLFPGNYNRARFTVSDRPEALEIDMLSRDSVVAVAVSARPAEKLESDLFGSITQAVEFFRGGSSGYSPSSRPECLDCVTMHCDRWEASPVVIEHMTSSLFDDDEMFPRSRCVLDSALVMRNLKARWTVDPRPQLRTVETGSFSSRCHRPGGSLYRGSE